MVYRHLIEIVSNILKEMKAKVIVSEGEGYIDKLLTHVKKQ